MTTPNEAGETTANRTTASGETANRTRLDPPAPDQTAAGEIAAVEARGLTRTFPSPDGGSIRVLRDIDLAVSPGESVAIVGQSGSGKSTLLQLLGGLDQPTAGEVWLAGQRVSALADAELASLRNAHVGFVFQFHHLLRDFTAVENVMIPQLVAGETNETAHARAMELLDQVGLVPRANHRPRKLSGGEQQRVAVARALANDPPLILADEPSGNLDAEATSRLHDLLFELLARHGTALIVVTHSRELAARAQTTLRLDPDGLAVT